VVSAEKGCVVGSGPAEATAAYFLWQAGFYVTVLDSVLPDTEPTAMAFDPMTHQRRPQDG